MKLIIYIPSYEIAELALKMQLAEESKENMQKRMEHYTHLIITNARLWNESIAANANIPDKATQEAVTYIALFAERLRNAKVVGICADTVPMDLIAEANKVILARPLGENTLNQLGDELCKSFKVSKEQTEQTEQQKPEFNAVMLDAMKAAGLIK